MKHSHIELKYITFQSYFPLFIQIHYFSKHTIQNSSASVSSAFQINSHMRATSFWNRHLRPPALSEVVHELSTAASRNQRERVYGGNWLPACGVRLATQPPSSHNLRGQPYNLPSATTFRQLVKPKFVNILHMDTLLPN